jgi:hypothetical protein
MSATAPQPATRQLPKVLRIGIAQEGKIVQEKLMKTAETVSVGDNQRNSFVVTGTKLPPRFDLFVPQRDGTYLLVVPEWIEGKISWKDGIKGLDEIRQRGDAVKKGDLWIYALNENVRGKVTIGSSTLLFQFVPAPPEPIRAVSAADFRPKLFDDDDPLFQGLLGVFSLIAAAFMAWVYTSEPSDHLDLADLDDATDLVVERKIEQVELVDPNAQSETPTETKQETKKEQPKEAKAESSADQTAKAPIERKSLLLQVIGTSGDAGGDAVADLIGDDAASMAGLDAALSGVSGVQLADASNVGARSGSAAGKGDATVGVVNAAAGNVGVGSGAVKVKAKVETGTADADVEEGDAGNIASVVRKSQGRIQTCLETALKGNPSVNGRVSVGWNIVKGKVTDARLVKNSTGDDQLGQCVVRAVRAFRFDESLTAEVQEFPWVVSGQ